jgi:hypothetical protein
MQNKIEEHQFLTFRKFNDLALAEQLISKLEEHGIVYELEDNSLRINPLVNNDELSKEYLVRLRKANFEKVTNFLLDDERRNFTEIESNYYLLSFTTDELMDVLTNYDEWNDFDVALARKLLNDRGELIDDEKIRSIKQERLQTLREPEKSQTLWIVAGYVFALLGGILGLFIGWHLSRYKKTLPNGEQVYGYLPTDRKQGNRIFILSIFCTIFWLIAKLILHTN